MRRFKNYLEEKLAAHIIRGDTYVGIPDRVVAQAKDKVKKMNPSTASEHEKAMNKVLSDMGWELTVGGKYVKEEIEQIDEISAELAQKVSSKRMQQASDLSRKATDQAKKGQLMKSLETGEKGREKEAKAAKAWSYASKKMGIRKEEVELDEGWTTVHDSGKTTSLNKNYVGKGNTEYHAFHYKDSKSDKPHKTEFLGTSHDEAMKKYKDILKKKGEMKEEVELDESNEMVRIGQKMLELAPKEKNDMISNAYSRLGDALTRYGTDFGPKNVKDLEKKTGLNQRIIMDLIKRAQK